MKCIRTLQQILKKGFILQIINQKDHWLEGNLKKVIGFTKNELGGKIMKEVVGLQAKNYLIDDSSEDNEAKDTKRVSQKESLNLKIMKNVYKQLN